MGYNPARWARFWRRFLAVQGTVMLAVLGLLIWWAIKGSVLYAVLLGVVLMINSFTLSLSIKWLRISISDQRRYEQ